MGLKLRVLDGEREAYYGTIGTLNDVALNNGAVLDIGGGSTNQPGAGRRCVRGQSAPVGALALTDRLVQHDPISDAEYKAVRGEIEHGTGQVRLAHRRQGPTGGAGRHEIRNMAHIEAERQSYPLSTLHGFELTLASVEESIRLFRTLPVQTAQGPQSARRPRRHHPGRTHW